MAGRLMLTIDESRVAMKTPTATMPSTSHWLGAASCRSVITRIVYYNCSAARSRSLKAEAPPTPSRRGWDDLEEAVPIGPGSRGILVEGIAEGERALLDERRTVVDRILDGPAGELRPFFEFVDLEEVRLAEVLGRAARQREVLGAVPAGDVDVERAAAGHILVAEPRRVAGWIGDVEIEIDRL